jgi:hypothetical protein
MSADARSLQRLGGRAGAYRKWAATEDRTAATEPARKAFNRRFEDAADPEAARRAYFAELALRSAQARRRRKTDTEGASRPLSATSTASDGRSGTRTQSSDEAEH